MSIYLVPIMVIHSFMGQFSSSGFISAFRLSPFFKGTYVTEKFKQILNIDRNINFRHGICEWIFNYLHANLL